MDAMQSGRKATHVRALMKSASGAALFLACAPAAWAQDQSSRERADAFWVDQNEIIVTVAKHEERLQDIPPSIDAYTIVKLYAGVQNDRFQMGVFADNVFDEAFIIGGLIPSSFFPPLLNIGAPRIMGVRARMDF